MDINWIWEGFLNFYLQAWTSIWLLVVIWMIFLFVFLYKYFPQSSFVVWFDMLFEKFYDFFEDILWKEEKRRIKVYITLLFFIILFANLFWIFMEFMVPIFGEWVKYIVTPPTWDINFNLAMAVIGVIIIIIEQFRSLWLWKALYEYFPVLWKDYIPYTRWIMPKYIDLPLFVLIKIFDIIISMFLWILEIIWHIAKIISLSFRLYWNMIAGGILLWMLVWGMAWLTLDMLGFQLPAIWPVIVYLQKLLVAFLQALVFPLLIAIFIKVSKIH